ncbi:hypothetical protein BDZ97DRAFT_1836081 [Flammula alnicola]|nr:hypothetical protein BDZ97DRAFT_1841032 [Flammula alnicola]KAF8959830.1 hypothetical protein BDZ97DRAFT_1836081 [Flammula alnicola]
MALTGVHLNYPGSGRLVYLAASTTLEGKVLPRSIAYVAMLLTFNLTDAEQWPADAIYNGFDFKTFYNVIVDNFDDTTVAIFCRNNKEVLVWWNKQVFLQHGSSTANDDSVWKSALRSALLFAPRDYRSI